MDDSLVLRSVLSLVMIGSGLLVVWMASAAASGQLQRNSVAGIRTPSTMASDVVWVAAHMRAKRPTMIAGYFALATGLVVLIPMPEWGIAVVMLGGCGALLGFVLYGARVGVQAAKAVLKAPGAKPAGEPDA